VLPDYDSAEAEANGLNQLKSSSPTQHELFSFHSEEKDESDLPALASMIAIAGMVTASHLVLAWKQP
jgi:hypothetical protein